MKLTEISRDYKKSALDFKQRASTLKMERQTVDKLSGEYARLSKRIKVCENMSRELSGYAAYLERYYRR